MSGVAWRSMALRLGFISILGGGAACGVCSVGIISPCGAFPGRLRAVLATAP